MHTIHNSRLSDGEARLAPRNIVTDGPIAIGDQTDVDGGIWVFDYKVEHGLPVWATIPSLRALDPKAGERLHAALACQSDERVEQPIKLWGPVAEKDGCRVYKASVWYVDGLGTASEEPVGFDDSPSLEKVRSRLRVQEQTKTNGRGLSR